MENLDIWDKCFKTDPAFTKKFNKGTYSGTAINPMYVYKKLTELFGACGVGWKVDIIDTQTQHFQDGAVIVSQTVKLYIKNGDSWSDGVVGTGGDYVRRITNAGKVMVDDDGYKKALTDAITNSTKMLGMSGDVYMGMYDDNKYVQSLENEFNQVPLIDKDQLSIIEDLIKKAGIDVSKVTELVKVKTLSDIPLSMFDKVKNKLELSIGDKDE